VIHSGLLALVTPTQSLYTRTPLEENTINHLVNKEILDPSTAINIVDEGKI
jgi:hypothetical protein